VRDDVTKALAGALLLGSLAGAQPALAAADCPGNPDALGTSRTLVVDPREHPRIGTMQYAETLPLNDKEVVLTFDDGPIPRYSNQILDVLKAECVKATFFVVGMMAKEHPAGVRRLRDEGHTIGTHTSHHPLGMKRMAAGPAQAEIDGGIAETTAALGGEAPAPFFRIPGLSRAEASEDHAAAKGLQVWSADFPADDWRHVTPQTVHGLAISRIEAKGKGILLLHDIQARTVAALPGILRDLKQRGYRIVHVVPSRPDRPATPTDPLQWRMHAPIAVATSRWPAVPGFAFTQTAMLPIPAMGAGEANEGSLMLLPQRFERNKRSRVAETQWPVYRASLAVANADTLTGLSGSASLQSTLPVPSEWLYTMQQPEAVMVGQPLALVDAEKTTTSQTASATPSARKSVGTAPTGRTPDLAQASPRSIPGSVPVTRPGLHPPH
jgi:peptidoglycan/xylan/chitin deacetylase (PgdA/CDA1 family)